MNNQQEVNKADEQQTFPMCLECENGNGFGQCGIPERFKDMGCVFYPKKK